MSDRVLRNQDIPDLVKALVTCSKKWELLGIALLLPQYVILECGNAGSNVVRLTNNYIRSMDKWGRATNIKQYSTGIREQDCCRETVV